MQSLLRFFKPATIIAWVLRFLGSQPGKELSAAVLSEARVLVSEAEVQFPPTDPAYPHLPNLPNRGEAKRQWVLRKLRESFGHLGDFALNLAIQLAVGALKKKITL